MAAPIPLFLLIYCAFTILKPSVANSLRLREAYLAHLPAALRQNQGIVLPGVRELLTHLQTRTEVVLGLLTGNVRAGGECKLRHYDLWQHFAFGGFADDIHDRDDVARHAVREMERHLGCAGAEHDVWVIGDTPLDVQCARAIGAKAVAVTTGWHTLEELQAAKPDHILVDLSSPEQLLQAWSIVT